MTNLLGPLGIPPEASSVAPAMMPAPTLPSAPAEAYTHIAVYDRGTGEIVRHATVVTADLHRATDPHEGHLFGTFDELSTRVVNGAPTTLDPTVVAKRRTMPSHFHRWDWATLDWVDTLAPADRGTLNGQAIRADRDARLAACDFTQLGDKYFSPVRLLSGAIDAQQPCVDG